MSRIRPKKKAVKIIEYLFSFVFIQVSKIIPWKLIPILSSFLGHFFFSLFRKWRLTAINNIRSAFLDEKNHREILDLARNSFSAFFVLVFETFKLRKYYKDPDIVNKLRGLTPNLDSLWERAKKIHDESKGCIFVTPHLGNWEYFPFIGKLAGIPITIVVRPLDNEYLEKFLFANRKAGGQVVIPKSNAMIILKKALKKGQSIGMLPDQAAVKGIPVRYFGRIARTTPIPAILSIQLRKPIVVVACCRKPDNLGYVGYVSDPISPETYSSEKEEIFRLTQRVNDQMEKIIRKFPDQYFWFHDRWQDYGDVRQYFT
jgi:KDO2-lipid IV(A) lauroyltransferase